MQEVLHFVASNTVGVGMIGTLLVVLAVVSGVRR